MAILDDIGLEGISFHLHGRRHLKGIGHVEVHELLYDDHGPRPLRQQPASTLRSPMDGGSHDDGREQEREWFGFRCRLDRALKRVGNYELESLLGSGGMGDVYKGRHTQFGRMRAIKVIKPQYVAAGNEEIIRRFYQEIKAVGALEHKQYCRGD